MVPLAEYRAIAYPPMIMKSRTTLRPTSTETAGVTPSTIVLSFAIESFLSRCSDRNDALATAAQPAFGESRSSLWISTTRSCALNPALGGNTCSAWPVNVANRPFTVSLARFVKSGS
jgi:hypothetical protein